VDKRPFGRQPFCAAVPNGTNTFMRRPSMIIGFGIEEDQERPRWGVSLTNAVLFHLRDAFRSGDVWLAHSRRYADLKQALVPIAEARATPRLTVPFDPEDWLADRKARMAEGLNRLARAARAGAIPGGSIEEGMLKIDKFTAAVPAEANKFVLDLYKKLPDVRITDLLLEADDDTGFTEAFTHIRTGAPCTDRIGLLTVLLAEGLNLGLSKMAEATSTHDYFQLSRISRWHVEGDALNCL